MKSLIETIAVGQKLKTILMSLFITGLLSGFIYPANGQIIGHPKQNKSYDLPTFEQYKVKVSKAKPKPIIFKNNKRARMFRTRLRRQYAQGINFAGHYIITTWGCGTGCRQASITDTRTGKVIWVNELADGFGLPVGYPEDKLLGEDLNIISFKKDSRLLITSGYIGEGSKEYGIRYFKWTGSRLKLIKFVPVKLIE